MFDNNDSYFDIVFSRLKEFVGTNKDAAVARELGVSRSNISTWKKKDALPHKEIDNWAIQKGVSLNWLYYGYPPMMLDDESHDDWYEPEGEFDSFDPESLEIAIECIELYINELDLKVTPAKKAKVIRMLYPLIRDDDDNEVPDNNNVIDLLKLAAEVEEEEGNNNEQKEQMADGHEGTGRRKISLD